MPLRNAKLRKRCKPHHAWFPCYPSLDVGKCNKTLRLIKRTIYLATRALHGCCSHRKRATSVQKLVIISFHA